MQPNFGNYVSKGFVITKVNKPFLLEHLYTSTDKFPLQKNGLNKNTPPALSRQKCVFICSISELMQIKSQFIGHHTNKQVYAGPVLNPAQAGPLGQSRHLSIFKCDGVGGGEDFEFELNLIGETIIYNFIIEKVQHGACKPNTNKLL